jgi:hypothetical protein
LHLWLLEVLAIQGDELINLCLARRGKNRRVLLGYHLRSVAYLLNLVDGQKSEGEFSKLGTLCHHLT